MATDLGDPTRPLDDLLRGDSVAGLTDADLVARIVAESGRRAEVAFATIVARHGPLVWGVCRRTLVDPADADDAFQATFLVLVRRARSIRVEGSLGRWLYGVGRRVAAKARARRSRLRRRDRGAGPLDRATDSPLDPGHAEVLAALDDAVDRLAEPFRSAVVLCDLGGLTHEQAAQEIGCPVGTVKSRLARGRDRLRVQLARRGFRPDDLTPCLTLGLARPTIPPALLGSVGRLVASSLAPGLIPAADLRRIAPLAHGVHPAMILSTASKWLVGLALGLGLTASGLTWAPGQTPSLPPPAAPPAATQAPAPAPADPKPPAQPDPTLTEVTVEARDPATDAPVPGVAIFVEATPPGLVEPAGIDAAGIARFTTDAAGLVHLRVRDQGRLERFSLRTGAEGGFVPLVVKRWFDGDGPTRRLRDRIVLKVERGIPIGGRVVDPAGRPVAGAAVIVQVKQGDPDITNQFVALDQATTDAAGRWSLPAAPPHPDQVRVTAYHQLHRSEHSSYQAELVDDLAAPAAGTLVTILPDRGTPLEGVVVDLAGRPVADAAVTLGGEFGYGNIIPPVRTDAEGRFQFGVRPGTDFNLVATHPAYGPAGMKVAVGSEPQRITLTLPPAATLGGRVVDPAGKPIPRAQVILTWQPGELDPRNYRAMPVGQQVDTDTDGRFAWPEAPSGAVQAEVFAGGYKAREGLRLTTGATNQVTLTRPKTIRGTVVAAATGQPIPDYRLTPGAAWNPGERLIWQRDDMFPITRTGPGTFEIASEMNVHEVALRIGGDDYHAETTPPIPMDGTTHDVTLRLTRGEPLVGRVVRPDGSPAPGVVAYLDRPDDTHRMDDGAIEPHEASRMTHAAVGPDGSFRLPPQREPFSLIALGDAGVAMLPVGGFRSGQAVTLHRWASVSGTCKLADAPGEGFYLSRDRGDPMRSPEAGYPTDEMIGAKVDPIGRFTIPRLTPGRHTLGRWVANNADRRQWFQALAVVDLRPGEARILDIGTTGRAATGRLRLPPLPAGQAPMLRLARVEPVAPAELDHERGARLLPDGRFRVENLSPGRYLLRLSVHEPPPGAACGWGRLLGRFEHPFTVAAGPAGDPVDLGTLEPVEGAIVPLQPGDVAPDLRVETLAGPPIAPAGLKGQVVLVDFWATWCAPCLAELPTLRAIHQEFAADPRFRLVSLSLDEDPKPLRAVVAAEQLAWPQALVGPEAAVVAAYGATAVPVSFLIGPDGRIIARDLRGAALRAAVAAALGRP